MSPDGQVTAIFGPEYKIDWPHNIASKGLGCCGYAVLDYAARWQNVKELIGLPERMRKDGVAGGAWPAKVEQVIARYASDCDWFQSEDRDEALVEALIRSKRMVCVDYSGSDPHYSGSVAHCVNLIYFDRGLDWVAVLDNNYPSAEEVIWMDVQNFRKRWRGWVYALLAAVPGDVATAQSASRPSSSPAWNAGYEWRPVPGLPDQSGLFSGGKQIGAWKAERREFWRLLPDGSWADRPEVPPIPPPGGAAWPALVEDGVLNFGLSRRLVAEAKGATRRGKPTSTAELLAAIGGEMVPAKPASPSGGGGLDLTAAWGGVPLWLLLALGATMFVMLLRRSE